MTVYFGKAKDGFEDGAIVYHPGGTWSKVSAAFVNMTREDHLDPPANWPMLVEDIGVARDIIRDLLRQLDRESGRAKKAWAALDDIETLCAKGFGRDEDD